MANHRHVHQQTNLGMDLLTLTKKKKKLTQTGHNAKCKILNHLEDTGLENEF